MKRNLSVVDRIEEYGMVILLAVMTIIIFVQVIARYVFRSSIPWSEEIARYLFIWIVYFAISYGVRVNAHIRVDAFITILPKFMEMPVRVFSNVLFMIFSGLMVYYGIKVVSFILASKQVSPALGIPMGLVYMAVPVGFVMTFIRIIQDTVKKIKGEE